MIPKDIPKLNCGHKFHLKCLKNVIDKICPLCRKPIPYGKPKKITMWMTINGIGMFDGCTDIKEMVEALDIYKWMLQKCGELDVKIE